MGNLTLEKRLVWEMGEPKPEPGHQVVVYKEQGKGRVFYQTLSRGEVFRPPLGGRFFGKYFAYAVSANNSLRHRFTEQLETGVGERSDVFQLHVVLTYRVHDAAALVDRLMDDPLGSLEAEIRNVFRNRVSKMHYAQLADDGFDIEGFFLHGAGRGADNLERFENLAQEYGIELTRVELTRSFSAASKTSARKMVRIDEEAMVGVHSARSRHQIRAAQEEGNRQQELLGTIGSRVSELAKNSATIGELKELMGQIGPAQGQIGGVYDGQTALPAAEGAARRALASGSPQGSLLDAVHEMFQMVGEVAFDPSEQRTLGGTLLHIFAEVFASDAAGDELERYLADFGDHCSAIDLTTRFSTQKQQQYFGQFRDAKTVRKAFTEGFAPEAGERGDVQ
jgi:hypothetical protein